jgi:hypothetical protein
MPAWLIRGNLVGMTRSWLYRSRFSLWQWRRWERINLDTSPWQGTDF